MIVEDRCDMRLACTVIDTMASMLGINVLTYRIGPNAEGGWQLVAATEDGAEQWSVEADRLYDAACELAELVGFHLIE